MQLYAVPIALIAACAAFAQPQQPDTDIHYQLSPDAMPQDGVPKGEMKGPFTLPSEAYPGTQHTYWIYVPDNYDANIAYSVVVWLHPLGNWWSRRHEYEADAFARAALGEAAPLVGALRKLHEKNLSNLTPHPAFSFFHYSHPTLLEREAALRAPA